MSTDDLAARLLHLHSEGLAKGAPVAPQVEMASMFHLPGDPAGVPGYGRMDNRTWSALEEALAALEDAPCLSFPSGMGAISAALFSCLKAGDRILVPTDGYYTTRVLSDRFLKALGVEMVLRETARFAEGGFEGFALVFLETPSNPGLDLCDIRSVADAVHAAGGLLVVDNTTMTPYGQRPLDLGADIVVASDTKAPNGHSDLLMGHVATRNADLLAAMRDWRKLAGGIPGPFEAWLTLRGLATLELRLSRMVASAEVIAGRLAEHPGVTDLRYPGLSNHPARAQMATPGFLMSFTLKDEATAERFINDCPLIQPATSFGGVHTSAERRARWGDAVAPGFVRLSVGIEPVETLWAAMAKVLP
ncbi:cystathionine gamma-lyase [Oceanicola sp. 22II-s10i]|uniref:cystathionine gamma-lyase n=1 Tax=Oceanicola sp. 22II-s10i TaxID=1317116 RepID=UPI000B528E51|nr:cystathionine gamma-lyase [Oceanicola sp. 22II-s10i]OWU86560.1 cystathionine gamma-lyase [Oceanicola sp. 22II-s10i]